MKAVRITLQIVGLFALVRSYLERVGLPGRRGRWSSGGPYQWHPL